jgi:hypothetical protein
MTPTTQEDDLTLLLTILSQIETTPPMDNTQKIFLMQQRQQQPQGASLGSAFYVPSFHRHLPLLEEPPS